MLHSFSALDIQKMRNNLKSSKSYPHDLKEKVSEEEEEEKEEQKQKQKKEQEEQQQQKQQEKKKDVQETKPAPNAVKQVAAAFSARNNTEITSSGPVGPVPVSSANPPTATATTAAVVVETVKKPESQLINVSYWEEFPGCPSRKIRWKS